MKLPLTYFRHPDVLLLSRDLLGKTLMTCIDGLMTGGIIIETEAYRGPEDRASHAYLGKRTRRNESMYAQGGICYLYKCYGIHDLFNVVTNEADTPHAILIRAILPTIGMDVMAKRRKMKAQNKALTSGPGSLSKALGLTVFHDKTPLDSNIIWIEDNNISIRNIKETPRIGIDYAGEDAFLPWRFIAEID